MSHYSYIDKSPELHTHTLFGKEFVIFPDVFSPAHFPSTEFFIENIPFGKGDVFLDMGTGSGAIAVFAALKGVKEVVAADINPTAVKNAAENVKRLDLQNKVTVVESDVFSNINKKCFDTIFWSMPFMPTEDSEQSMYNRSFADYEYKSINSFFSEVRNHLSEKGRIFVGFSEDLGDSIKFDEILNKNNFSSKVIAEQEVLEGKTKFLFSLLEVVNK